MRPDAASRRPSTQPAGRRSGRVAARPRTAAVWLAVCGVVFGAPRAQSAPPPSFQHEVEASFVYTVSKFVEWPPGAFAGTASPLVFVVLGDDPVEDSLKRMVAGKTVGGHPVQVIRVTDQEDLVPCHVLFVGRSEAARVDEVIGRLQGASVLTVGDFERFAQRGGVLRLRLEENMVRFEVNVDAAQRAGLKVSSKILKLGKVVRDKKRAQGAR